MTKSWSLALWSFASLALGGCGSESSRTVHSVPQWTLTQRLQIGVIEGDKAYEFDNVVGALVLANGEVVVADGRSNELRFFDARGQHRRTAGRGGGGPGEFRFLNRLYPYGSDSLLVADFAKPGVVVLDLAGNYARMIPADSISGDSVYRLDVWLYRDFWVEGALYAAERGPIAQILDSLPPLDDRTAYRFVRRDARGNLWIREPFAPERASWVWTVAGPSGTPIARVETPHAFTVLYIAGDHVTGKWRDVNDVEFVRIYDLSPSSIDGPVPSWLSSGVSRGARSTDEADLVEIRGALRNIAGAQERHYASNQSYTLDLSALELELPEGMIVEIVFAFPFGWRAVGGYVGSGWVCGMAVGLATPPGWPEGVVQCG